MKNKKDEILKSISGLLSQAEDAELKEHINKSADLNNFSSRFQANIDEMKNVYKVFPDQDYLNNLSNSIISKAEGSYKIRLQPSFAYAFIVAFVILIASQLINFNLTNFNSEYSELMNATDIEDYLTLNYSLELNYFTDIIDAELDLDYTSYLFDSNQESYIYISSEESKIINLLDKTSQEKIFNGIVDKKIL